MALGGFVWARRRKAPFRKGVVSRAKHPPRMSSVCHDDIHGNYLYLLHSSGWRLTATSCTAGLVRFYLAGDREQRFEHNDVERAWKSPARGMLAGL
jgi:hypothetical protein